MKQSKRTKIKSDKQIQNPEKYRGPFDPLHDQSRNSHRHWRELANEYQIKSASAQDRPQYAGTHGKGEIVSHQPQAPAVTTRNQRRAHHPDPVIIFRPVDIAIAGKEPACGIIGRTGQNRHRVPAFGHLQSQFIDPKILRPKILRDNQ